ncbi:hypothetical protein [Sinomicrobium sp. M5D2P9]
MNARLTQEQKIRILNSDDVYKVMQQVLLRENKIRRNQEYFGVVGLDAIKNIPVLIICLSVSYGDLDILPQDRMP